jgi:hypothetical protein
MRSLAFSFKKGTYLKMLFIPFSCINAVYSPALLLLQLKGAARRRLLLHMQKYKGMRKKVSLFPFVLNYFLCKRATQLNVPVPST